MVPAHQRLVADDIRGTGPHNGLVHQRELAVGQRLWQLGTQRDARAPPRSPSRGGRMRKLFPARAWRRNIASSASRNTSDACSATSSDARDAKATPRTPGSASGGSRRVRTARASRAAKRRRRQTLGLARAVRVGVDADEHVATNARDVPVLGRSGEALRHHLQELVGPAAASELLVVSVRKSSRSNLISATERSGSARRSATYCRAATRSARPVR